ncbi:MAG: hypothetical protein NTW86_21645 [Candidatus Sumerlaeota bacterium]|nr:hypothetical protein [Candidatus Sumerlaeota bacterium]
MARARVRRDGAEKARAFRRAVAGTCLFAMAWGAPTAFADAGPAYPLFAIASGTNDFTAADNLVVAPNFLFCHGTMSTAEISALHAVNPAYVQLKYVNDAKTQNAADVGTVEHSARGDILYYKAAKLAQAISAADTQFTLAQSGGAIALKASSIAGDYSSDKNNPPSTQNYVVWIRVDTEYMRVNAWDSGTKQITVTRAFAATTASAHALNALVFVPCYNSPNEYPGGSATAIAYYFDPKGLTRWDWSLQDALANDAAGYDGTWFDLISATPFNMCDINGGSVSAWWDFSKNQAYVADDFREYTEAGINYVQNQFQTQKARWPIIYCNNMTDNQYEPGSGGKKYLLMSTAVKPRPVDGYCIESFAGSMDEAAFQEWRQNGTMSPPNYPSLSEWKGNVQMLMKAAQAGLAACPSIMNAGWKTQMFEHFPTDVRDKFEDWAYASYLIGVEKTGTNCPTRLGLWPFYWSESTRYAALHPRYTWPIGDPAETRTYDQVDQYKPSGHASYRRRFTNGVAVVNPSTSADNGVPLGGSYYDPEASAWATSVDMAAQTGKIFLSSPPSGVSEWRRY